MLFYPKFHTKQLFANSSSWASSEIRCTIYSRSRALARERETVNQLGVVVDVQCQWLLATAPVRRRVMFLGALKCMHAELLVRTVVRKHRNVR